LQLDNVVSWKKGPKMGKLSSTLLPTLIILVTVAVRTSYGCSCLNDYQNPDCVTDRPCGCDPIIGSCSEKQERDHANPAYICPGQAGWGDGICIQFPNVLCYEWRDCGQTGVHMFEICCATEEFWWGFCTYYPWPYCQDCEGVGIWHPQYVENVLCCFP